MIYNLRTNFRQIPSFHDLQLMEWDIPITDVARIATNSEAMIIPQNDLFQLVGPRLRVPVKDLLLPLRDSTWIKLSMDHSSSLLTPLMLDP
jgi:hypothetical protein